MSDFEVILSSDLEYEKMVVNIDFKCDTVAIINYENGIDNPEIKIFDKSEEKVIWTFNYFDFLEALKEGFEELKKT